MKSDQVVLGVDFGTKRIGLAISSTSILPASPVITLLRSRRQGHDLAEICRHAALQHASIIVVGIPYRKNDVSGKMANQALEFVNALRKVSQLPIDTVNESFTTAYADMDMEMAGISPEKQTKLRDAVAACHIITAWRLAQEKNSSVDSSAGV